MLRTPALLQCLLRNTKNGEEPRRELAARKTLASFTTALAPASALLLIRQLSGLATAALHCSFAAVSMAAETYDDDEVGTGLYILIGGAAVTVVLMYSWIGYTLYQGFKARRKVD